MWRGTNIRIPATASATNKQTTKFRETIIYTVSIVFQIICWPAENQQLFLRSNSFLLLPKTLYIPQIKYKNNCYSPVKFTIMLRKWPRAIVLFPRIFSPTHTNMSAHLPDKHKHDASTYDVNKKYEIPAINRRSAGEHGGPITCAVLIIYF